MKVTVDRDTCIGCGVCVAMCPDLFKLDDESIAIVKTNTVPPNLETEARETAESCAVDAIYIEE